jgi:hypothetical protein
MSQDQLTGKSYAQKKVAQHKLTDPETQIDRPRIQHVCYQQTQHMPLLLSSMLNNVPVGNLANSLFTRLICSNHCFVLRFFCL